MSNMSYCRFQNTLLDLRDCLEALREMNDEETQDTLSADESRALRGLKETCADFLQEVGE